uniref:Galectin n=1 Tax=Elaeophora elaphi TaxID=1147741 RepID=A0A0R3RWZ4_9BILA
MSLKCLIYLVLISVGLLLLEVCLSEDEMQPREVNYKKFIGERHYVVPFKTRISQPFQEGQTIHGVGMIKPDAKRIDINFHKGASRNADLPLHLSIRFDEGKMVYNTYMGGIWSSNEQRLKNLFKPNTEMDIRIRIINKKYQIFANRVAAGTFEQRVPLDGVDHVSINGDLVSLRLFHYGGRVFPIPYTAVAEVVPGKRLDISLLPTDKHLKCVNGHFTNCIDADITVINERYSFQIFFNGVRFTTFAHRGSPDDIRTLEIDGECEIFSVTVNNAGGE